MGGDTGNISFTKQLKLNKKLGRRLIVAVSVFLALIVVFKVCKNDNNNNGDTTDPPLIQKRGESPFFASPPPTPDIVWLMTMSNAGSSFLISLVARATNFSMATNYGQDVTPTKHYSISINPRLHCGPYWAGLGDTALTSTKRKLPNNSVLVHTYCQTKTTTFVPTLEEYMQDCVTTFGRTAPDPTILTRHEYPLSRVTKAIHLIRNPISQIITKFQKEFKSHVQDTSWRSDYPLTKSGFKKWCQAADVRTETLFHEYYSAGTVQTMQETPCGRYIAEFISWHNHAFDTIASLDIPELVIYHDDLYDDSLETTLHTMLDFIELKQQTMPSQRLGDSDIDVNEFLSRSDFKQIRRLVQKLATDETWSHLERYFKDVV
jgi:hypothetical protein